MYVLYFELPVLNLRQFIFFSGPVLCLWANLFQPTKCWRLNLNEVVFSWEFYLFAFSTNFWKKKKSVIVLVIDITVWNYLEQLSDLPWETLEFLKNHLLRQFGIWNFLYSFLKEGKQWGLMDTGQPTKVL